MTRTPVQQRSKAKVERIIRAAQALLAGPDNSANLRSLAKKAEVSLGTVYQYFESMDAVRAAVGKRAGALLRAALQQHVPAPMAADPERYFTALIACIDHIQRSNPELGCMIRAGTRSPYVEELGNELRAITESHVRLSFKGRIREDELPARLQLEMAMRATTELLSRAPGRDSPARAAYLGRVARVTASLISIKSG